MDRVSAYSPVLVCAVVALLAVGLATGRPEARAADTEYLYEGEALATELEDAEGLESDAVEDVRERRDAMPTSPEPPPMPYNDSALDMLADGFDTYGSLEAQLAPKLGQEKKACGRGTRGQPPSDAGNATDTTGTDEAGDMRRGGGRRAKGGRGSRNSTDTTATATGTG